MRHSTDHCSHGGKALAFHDLLLELPLDRDIADRNDHTAELALAVHQLAPGGTHGSPASIAMTRSIFGRTKRLLLGNDRLIEREQVGRMVAHLRNLLAQHLVRPIAKNLKRT